LYNVYASAASITWVDDITGICTIKEEEVYLADYVDYWDAYHQIGHFIEDVYQAKRIHSA